MELKRVKHKTIFEKDRYSSNKDSLVFLNELQNILFDSQNEIDRSDVESLLFTFLSSESKEIKKEKIKSLLLKYNKGIRENTVGVLLNHILNLVVKIR